MRRVALYDVGNPWCGVKLDLLDRISLTHKYVFPPRFEQVPYMEKARSGMEILPLSKLFQKDMCLLTLDIQAKITTSLCMTQK